MLLSIIIIAVFLFSFWRGWRRGVFLQLVSLFSTGIALLLATIFYEKLSSELVTRLHLDVPQNATTYLFDHAVMTKAGQPFFAAFVFVFLFFAAKIVLRLLVIIIGSFRNFFPSRKTGPLIGGLLGLLLAYLSIQVILTMISIFPATATQQLLANSDLASWMILHTPISSSLLLQLFIENIIHIPAL